MKWLYYTLFVGFFFGGCDASKEPTPLLTPEQMQQVVYRLSVLNAAKNVDYAAFDHYYIDTQALIYEPYGLDSLSFVENLRYYTARPLVHQQILEQVSERMIKMQHIISKEIVPIKVELEEEIFGGNVIENQ